jgi:hypothetical protein
MQIDLRWPSRSNSWLKSSIRGDEGGSRFEELKGQRIDLSAQKEKACGMQGNRPSDARGDPRPDSLDR